MTNPDGMMPFVRMDVTRTASGGRVRVCALNINSRWQKVQRIGVK